MSTFTIIFFSFFLSHGAFADMNSSFGFGSTTAALAGSNRSKSYDAYTMERNPSLMSFDGSRTSFGLLGAIDKFDDLQNVQTDNVYLGGTNTTGNVSSDVPDTFNFLLGSIWKLGNSVHEYRLGFAFSVPVDKTTEPASQDAYRPQYAMYFDDTQRLSMSLGLSGLLTERWAFGMGVSYYLSGGATFVTRLPTDGSPQRTSTANLKATVKPAWAPIIGMTFKFSDNDYFGINYIGERNQKLNDHTEAVIGLIGSTPLTFDGNTTLFYDPETISWGYHHSWGATDLLFSLDYERWSKYNGGYFRMNFGTWQGTFTQYPIDPAYTQYHDIWTPHVGLTTPLLGGNYRIGYSYRMSPTPPLDGPTNFMDSNRHVLGMGFGHSTTLFGIVDKGASLELHTQAHYLVPRDVVKADPTSLGAPGYKIRGWVFSYGINLNLEM